VKSRLLRRAVAALLAAALLPSYGRATTFEEVDARCPACAHRFKARQPKSSNAFGGIDADGCVHANGDSPLPWLVRVCPKCPCAREPGDHDRPPAGEKARAFLEEAALWSRRPGRHELAAGLLEAEGAPPAQRAEAWLREAWTVRGHVRAELLHPEDEWDPSVPKEWRALLDEARQVETSLDRTVLGARTRAGREMLAAREILRAAESAKVPEPGLLLKKHLVRVVALSHGEQGLVRDLPADGGKQPPRFFPGEKAEERGVEGWTRYSATNLGSSAQLERESLRKCLDACLVDLAEGRLRGPGKARTAWMASECCRRLGNDLNASSWLARFLDADDCPDGVLVLLRDVAAVVGDGTPSWKARVERAWDERIASLVGLLADPEKGEDAAARLAKIADPAALPALVKSLAGEGKACAAAALAGYEEPGPEALKALQGIASDTEEDPEARWRAVEALAATAAPSSAAALRKALADGGLLAEPATRGLGLVGDASDVPAILAAAEEEPKPALRALSLLAAREFKSGEEFRPWWEKNRERGREAWALEALRAAGATLDRLEDKASVPALVPLLENRSLPVRWNTFRALRAATGKGIAIRDVLYEGRMRNPEPPDAPLDLDHVLGNGWTIGYGALADFDLDAMGDLVQPLRDRDGKHAWERALARWRKALSL